jgi:hypothetical protein
MLTWMAAGAWAGTCPEVVAAGKVSARLDEAVLSFAVLDQEAFERAADEAQALATCVAGPLDPSLAAALHRVRGMRYLLLGDAEKAGTSFVAAAHLDPAYVLPATVAPEGGPLAESMAAARTTAPPPTFPLDLADGLSAWVDGHAGAPRPTIGPYWLQVQGRTLWTGWIPEGPPDASLFPAPGAPTAAPAPVTPVGPAPAPVVAAPAPPPPRPQALADLEAEPAPAPRSNTPLLVAGVGTGVVAGGLWTTAAVTRAGYATDPTASRYSLINGTWLASVGTGALSAALLTTWLATR